MKERVTFLLIYFIFWLAFFLVARTLFLIYHIKDTQELALSVIFGIFRYGIKMDLSMAGYLSIGPFLWVSFSSFIKRSVLHNLIFTYTFIMVVVMNLIIVIDLEVYSTWSFRIDSTPFQYLSSLKEAFKSVRSSPIIPLLISLLVLILTANYIIYRILTETLNRWRSVSKFPFIMISLLLSTSLLIPIRGSVDMAPIDQDAVYFSENSFANIASLNAAWNFFRSIVHQASEKENPYTLFPKSELNRTIKALFPKEKDQEQAIRLRTSSPNILIILWPNFTKKSLESQYEGKEITPYFNQLKNESIYFSNAYATTSQSGNSLINVISGYTSQPKQFIMSPLMKTAKLPSLAHDFDLKGYRTQFYYSGNLDSTYFKPYLYADHFRQIVSGSDFPDNYNRLGSKDERIFERFLNDHQEVLSKPFFSTLLMLDHQIFSAWPSPISKKSSRQTVNSLTHTDETLGRFIEKAKRSVWWTNTIIIIVAAPQASTSKPSLSIHDFEVPILWTGGVIQKAQQINKVTGQNDIAASLLGQLHMDYSTYTFSKNVFSNQALSWAFFAFENGFGWVNQQKAYMYDNARKSVIWEKGNPTKEDYHNGKAFLQKSYQDFLER